MSTTAPPATNGHSEPEDGVRTYRGRKLEDLIPRIKEDLGPDAIILREREGLMGGINGFFAQRFVEIEARAGARRVDLYDEPVDDTFASQLEHAATPFIDDPRPTPPSASVPAADALMPEPSAPAMPELSAPPTAPAMPGLSAPPTVPAMPEFDLDDEAGYDEEIVEITPEAITGMGVSTPAAGVRADAPTTAEPEPVAEAAPAAEPTPAPAPAAPVKARRRGSRLRARTGSATPQHELDAGAAAALMTNLSARGVSPAWARELIGEAGAHFGPFAQTSLQDAVRGAIAATLSSAHPLPSTGAAVAFVGSGGAGKSRCVATLAAAYRRGSTLPVTVLSLAGAREARALADLLKSHGIPVASVADGRSLARRVEKGRAGGLVVIDTGAAVASDVGSITSLAAQLAPLSLDATVLALPATLGAETAKRLLISLSPLGMTAIAVTHADETDQLGVAVELAAATRTPISYLHEGLDIDHALSAPSPFTLAQRLLP